ncbi:hypothetical protein [Amycolatopsis sp. WQ 127309]|uniref:hypothetical protein n=1 Tax=Amycolatopsis sp. WQ 127309 TaxID=2932773 RepID=UPI001FF64E5B|nr:hypothetical protein [Amycolatopsis sp. WQ 127309]UOZ03497.1 hypothetical protein MUY22_32165 [Amycolatopsis sp. WQ 127309]
MRDEDIVAAAREIRDEWVALPVARQVDGLLARTDAGEPVADEILRLLTAEPGLRMALRRRLPKEPDTTRATESVGTYTHLPGRGEPSAVLRYGCADCGYEYPVFEVGEPVPERCPRGHGPLTAAG